MMFRPGPAARCGMLMLAAMLLDAPAAKAQTTRQPELKTLKADFVPGERTIFFDDFSDMGADDAPPHFKSRGAAPELRAGDGIKQLTIVQGNTLTPNLTALPPNFTFESDVKFDTPKGLGRIFVSLFSKNREAVTWMLSVRATGIDTTLAQKLPKYQELARKTGIKVPLAEPAALAWWIQDGRLRLFINGERHVDVNQVELPPIDRVEIKTDIVGAGTTVGFRRVRFAESAPDVSASINAAGRYVSHGITFDTDSDRLKPESAASVQAVAKALELNPNLRLRIEGHTDALGDATHNLNLSTRRAEAVKAVLVGQFGVDSSRLTATGLGATKPADSNDTPAGRAQNRRVEFVRQ